MSVGCSNQADATATAVCPVHGGLVRLAEAVGELLGARRWGDTAVVECTDDSRQVRPGWLFAAVRGAHVDGHDHAAAAVDAGAAALLVERRLPLPVPQVVVPSVAAALGPVASVIHGQPSRSFPLAGITGTNGKTTIAFLVQSAMTAAAWRGGLISTVESRFGQQREPAAFTTPPAPVLQRTFARMRAADVNAAVMEVSSHALDQHRVNGVDFDVGVFTNLRPEHLDYHGTIEQYYSAKAALFAPSRCRQAIVGVDDEWGRRLAAQARVPVTTFGQSHDADVSARVIASDLTGMRVALEGKGLTVELETPIVGQHNVVNVAAAYLTARALGIQPEAVRAGLRQRVQVPGRFEAVDVGQPFAVVVDFAHTPDAMRALITTARRLAPDGRVIVVAGAAGGRDRFNRPELGRAACAADVVILTTDDPAHDNPRRILAEVRLGALGEPDVQVTVEPDRETAIRLAVSTARAGDIVLVAGRGHETTQPVDGREVPFDDRVVARAALEQESWRGAAGNNDGRDCSRTSVQQFPEYEQRHGIQRSV